MDILIQALIAWTVSLFLWTVSLVWLTVALLKEETEFTRRQMHQAWWIRRQERESRERF